MSHKNNNISTTFFLFIILGIFCLFIPTRSFSFEVNAAGKITVTYPTDDLVMPQMPEHTEGETVVIDGMILFPNNSTNFNYDVSVGQHYRYLDSTEKSLYRAMVAAAGHVYEYGTSNYSYEDEGMIPLAIGEASSFTYGQYQYQNAYEAARADHPDMMQFNLCKVYTISDPTYYSSLDTYTYNTYLYMKSDKEGYNQNRFDQMTAQIRAKRAEILSDASIAGAQGALEKELAIHDKLLELITYDHACANGNSAYHISHTAYGALLNGTCVCDGYSLAFSYLLEGVGINSMIITGRAGEQATGNHAWNIVKLDGSWYEVDCTWDDYEPKQVLPEAFVVEIQHLYYHLTTAQISDYEYVVSSSGYSTTGTRRRVRSYYSVLCPIATGTQYSYQNVKNAISGNEELELVPLTSLSISPGTIDSTIGAEGNFNLVREPVDATGMDIIWLSSDESVITVDETGRYRVAGSGVATVMACSENGRVKSNKCNVIIKDANGNTPVGGITLSPEKMTKYIGDTGVISFGFYPSDASNKNVTWKSTNEGVARLELVEGQGLKYTITGNGKTMITVTTEDGGYEGFCNLVVPIQYSKVSFDLNGGPGTVADVTMTVGSNYFNLPRATWEGHYFEGWYTQSVGGTKVTTLTKVTNSEDHTLYAHWTQLKYAVHFYANGGSYENGSGEMYITRDYGTRIYAANMPIPERTGFVFKGYSHDMYSKVSVSHIVVADECYLYAIWEEVSDTGNNTSNTGQTSQDNTNQNNNEGIQGSAGNDNNNTAGQGGIAGDDRNTQRENSGNTGNNRNNVTDNGGKTDNGQNNVTGNSGKNNNNQSKTSDDSDNETSKDSDSETDGRTQGDTDGNVDTSDYSDDQSDEDSDEDDPGIEDVTISSAGALYELSESGEATVQNTYNKKLKKLVIKDSVSYKGYQFKVTEIQNNAFKNCKNLKSLTIGDNVRRIGSGAFRNCKNLSKITIKTGNLQTIGCSSFKGIKKGATITIMCKDKKTYNKWVKRLKKVGAKNAKFKFKKSK